MVDMAYVHGLEKAQDIIGELLADNQKHHDEAWDEYQKHKNNYTTYEADEALTEVCHCGRIAVALCDARLRISNEICDQYERDAV